MESFFNGGNPGPGRVDKIWRETMSRRLLTALLALGLAFVIFCAVHANAAEPMPEGARDYHALFNLPLYFIEWVDGERSVTWSIYDYDDQGRKLDKEPKAPVEAPIKL